MAGRTATAQPFHAPATCRVAALSRFHTLMPAIVVRMHDSSASL